MGEHRILSVIIVNYNHGAFLPACLDSIFATAADLAPEVIVVDNASRDGSLAEIRRRFPAVSCLANAENVGFARATNQALAAAEGAYLLLLNPDTRVLEGAIEGLVGYLAGHPEVGAVGPRMLGPDGTLQLSCRAFPSYATALFGRYSLLTRWFPRNPWSRRYLLSDWDHAVTREVDWVSGACLMTRRDVVEQVGLLDEEFFLFNEDVDWCRRMGNAGWKVVYRPEARVIHHIGASKDKVPAALVIARHRGMIHYYRKHLRRGPARDLVVRLLIWARCGWHLLVNALRRG